MSRLTEIDVTRAVAVVESLGDDAPVSGGVGAVLARGGGLGWSEAQDSALLSADPRDVPDLAREMGIALSTAQTRKAALEARVMELMG